MGRPKKPEHTENGGLPRRSQNRIRKNFIPGQKRNGPFTPEELIPYGITRPMRANYNRDRMYLQTCRIITECGKQLNIPKPLAYHLAALYLVERINEACRKAGTAMLDVAAIEKESDYVPLEGAYANWMERYQAAVLKMQEEQHGKME